MPSSRAGPMRCGWRTKGSTRPRGADPTEDRRLAEDLGAHPAPRYLVLGMSDLGDRFRLVGNEITVVPAPEAMPKLPVGRAVWRPKPDFSTSTEGWLLAGGPHHTVLSTALTSTHLDHLAEILGLELALIGEGTTTRSFRNELRWNSAYHRLAGGL